MATIGNSVLTLADLAKNFADSNMQQEAMIAEVLSQENELLGVLPFAESNTPTSNITTIRAGLPTVGFRQANKSVAQTKAANKQFTDSMAVIESYCEVDELIYNIGNKGPILMANEGMAHMEAIGQTFASTFAYGNPAANPERFLGLSPRYNLKAGETGGQIIDMGGTGSDNLSIWLVGLGERGLTGLYPMGQNAGLQHEDLGKQVVRDATGVRTAYMARYSWACFMKVHNFRSAVRISNVSVSALPTFGSGSDTSAKLVRGMIQAMNAVPKLSDTANLKYYFLMNQTAKTWADIQQTDKSNNFFTVSEVNGIPLTKFRGIPVLKMDALLNNESRVV